MLKGSILKGKLWLLVLFSYYTVVSRCNYYSISYSSYSNSIFCNFSKNEEYFHKTLEALLCKERLTMAPPSATKDAMEMFEL